MVSLYMLARTLLGLCESDGNLKKVQFVRDFLGNLTELVKQGKYTLLFLLIQT